MEEKFDVLDEWGYFTGETALRSECHKKGYWHRAISVFIVSTDNKRVLLNQRAANKKLWANMWDQTAGGHVLAGELGYQAAIRETKEEIGLDVDKKDILLFGTCISENKEKDIINRHFNEYYIVSKDIDIASLKLQTEEVQDIRWFSKDELIKRIDNDLEDLAKKDGMWDYLKVYFDYTKKRTN